MCMLALCRPNRCSLLITSRPGNERIPRTLDQAMIKRRSLCFQTDKPEKMCPCFVGSPDVRKKVRSYIVDLTYANYSVSDEGDC